VKKNIRKSREILRVCVLSILLVAMIAIAPGLVGAEEGDGGQLIQDVSGIRMENSDGDKPSLSDFGAPKDGIILFEQTPHSYDASWTAYTSDSTLGYICKEDFWELSENITDIHWYGMSNYYEFDWYECNPIGMQFEIVFYQDSGGAPGSTVATYSGITPAFTYYDTYGGYPVYRFDVDSLPGAVSLTQGWVSIQSTYSPNNCSFLWLSSPDGNLNAIQEGGYGPTDDNLSLILTGEGYEYGDAPEGALAYPNSLVTGAFPTCKNVPVAGYIEHNNFGAWFGPGYDFEGDGNGGCCPMFQPDSYDQDECFNDGDAGIVKPVPYTMRSGMVVPCACGSGACEYEICLEDDYGDGWNGGTVDVSVNGNFVYTGLTLSSGYGPVCHTIPVDNSDEITVDFTGGSWVYECSYYIYDSEGNLIRSEGVGGIDPGDVLSGELNAVCPSTVGGTPLGTICHQAQWGRDIDIHVHNTMPSETIGYVNVLIDWNLDGQWSGSSDCGGVTVAEHVLQNLPIPNGYDGTLSALGPPDFTIGPKQGYVWTRFSITESPVVEDWDGDGVFEDGETEDYLLRIDPELPIGGEAFSIDKSKLILYLGLIILAAGIAVLFVKRRTA
jgi:hypothetical protein